MKKLKMLVLWSLYALCLIVFTDVCSRFVMPKMEQKAFAGDVSWRRWWVKRHSGTNEIYYPFDRFDKTKGWISKSNLRDQPAFTSKILNTNSLGLRGSLDYSLTPVPGKKRVLILGDSLVFGDDVSDNETFSYYLQEILPQYEILNFGVHGYGHDQMLVLLREIGFKYNPDIVVLGFTESDMERNVLYFRDYAKPKFEISNKEKLVLTRALVPSPEETLSRDWMHRGIWDLIEFQKFLYEMKSGRIDKEINQITELILKEMKEDTESKKANPLFFYLPWGKELAAVDTPVFEREEYLFNFCKKYNANCGSAHAAFKTEINKGKSFGNGHWVPEGQKLVARALADNLLGMSPKTHQN